MKKNIAFPITLCLILSGCGLTPLQKQQVAQFATATESVATTTQDRFKAARDKVMELERRRLIMRNEEPPKSFDIDGGLSAEGIASQIATLKALQSYGDVLNKLASNDQGEAITKAATDFLTQFEAAKQVQDAMYKLDDNKKTAVLGVVGIVGTWFVESEKKKKIRPIIEAYSEDIGKLAALLKNDLTLVEDSLCIEESKRKSRISATGVMDIYCTSADAVGELASDLLKEPNHSYNEREFAYDSYILAQTAKVEISILSAQGDKLVEKLTKANDQLLGVIKEDKFTADEIKAFAKQVEELNNHIAVLAGK
ncbi:hypothetical protein L2750_13550 [Shewanella submarina]|uniref:Lipoprotein n=1 Tax=Shewanella submarina TaxID=2016376 RepID=A0ABV7GE16_9GAMM|nr:hypothetical protein [Shewanella submarina]MCL1038172.1 hypothetical protein [Shewanella submarina]